MIGTGFAMVAAAIWVVPETQALATALVVFGAGMVTVGALLPRIEGVVTLSLQEGLKFSLEAQRATERKATEQQLSPEKTEQAVNIAVETAVAQVVRPVMRQHLSHGTDALIAAPTAEAIADAAIDRVIDLDEARERRRREGHDVDNEPGFEDVMKKIEAGESLTPEEQASVDRLTESLNRLLRRIWPRAEG
jgi:hypothetical protein